MGYAAAEMLFTEILLTGEQRVSSAPSFGSSLPVASTAGGSFGCLASLRDHKSDAQR